MSNSLWPDGLQHARPPCPSSTPGACSNSCPLSRWCHPTISSSAVPFSSCLQSLPASGSFPMSQFFTSGGQSIGASASASVLPMNIQDWPPLGWAGWISLSPRGLKGLSFPYTLPLLPSSFTSFFSGINLNGCLFFCKQTFPQTGLVLVRNLGLQDIKHSTGLSK